MRTKEILADYRYFPDPDLTPIAVDKSWKEVLKLEIPELPMDKQRRYVDTMKLPENDAVVLTESTGISEYFEQVANFSKNPKISANWVMGPVKSALNDKGIQISEFPVTPYQLGTIIAWVDAGILSQNVAAKQLFPSILSYPDESLDDLLEKLDLVKSDDQDIERIVKNVLKDFPKEAEMLKKGKNKLFGMFMGKVMQASKGGIDPKKANDILQRLMNNK